jgi:hypothetical protein
MQSRILDMKKNLLLRSAMDDDYRSIAMVNRKEARC